MNHLYKIKCESCGELKDTDYFTQRQLASCFPYCQRCEIEIDDEFNDMAVNSMLRNEREYTSKAFALTFIGYVGLMAIGAYLALAMLYTEDEMYSTAISFWGSLL